MTLTPLPPAGGTNPHVVCLTDAGILTLDPNSNTTCAGAQTNVTGITVTNGGGFTAAGTAGVAVVGSGTISTSSGNIFSASGDLVTTTGNVFAGGALTTGGNATIGGNLDMTNGAISNVTDLTAVGTVQAGTLTDGIASITGGNLTGVATLTAVTGNIATVNSTTGNIATVNATDVNTANVTATGTVQGATVTDGTASLSGGNLSGVGTLTAVTGNVTTVNSSTVNAVNVNTTSVSATGSIQAGTLSDGAGTTISGGTVTTNSVSAAGGTIGSLASTAISNSGAISTGSLAVGTGGLSVAAGAPVSVGGNRIQNVAGPAAATDAANKAYVDAAVSSTNSALDDRIGKAFDKIDENTEGIAVAIAMGGLVLPAQKSFAIGANLGFYEDKQALAAQTAIRLDETFTLNAGVGIGFDESKVGGRVGFMAAW